MQPQFAPALSRLQFLLTRASRDLKTPIHFALIGGLSVAAWGIVRATEDIDYLADSEPSPIGDPNLRNQLKRFFERQHCRVEWRIGDYDDPVPLLLRIELPRSYGGLGADILWTLAPRGFGAFYQRKSISPPSSRASSGGLLLKLEAGGPQDLSDVGGLLADPPPQLNLARLEKTAARLRMGRALEKCLRQLKNKP